MNRKSKIPPKTWDFALNDDDFFTKNKFGWDMVIVFPSGREFEKLVYKKILSIHEAGLHTSCRFSCSKPTHILCKVRAPIERLQEFADYTDYKCLLNEQECQFRMETGEAVAGRKVKGRTIPHDISFSPLRPFQFIYGKYDSLVDLQKIFRPNERDPLEPYVDHAFRSTVRLKIIEYILRSDKEVGGAELNLRVLLQQKDILAFYPLHKETAVDYLQENWNRWTLAPWKQPLTQIKDYFGEAIGLYFAFMGHYTKWLVPCAIIGIVLGLGTYAQRQTDSPLLACFGVFIAVWGIMMLEFWKRKEVMYALQWGTLGVEDEQLDRPEFAGLPKESPVDGSIIYHFPIHMKRKKVAQAVCVIVMLAIVVLACIFGIFMLRWYLQTFSWGDQWGPRIASLLNAIQIQCLNHIYKLIALRLNQYENHRTDTEYQDSLIAKVFLFQFVNSYASFIFIAFVQEPVLHISCGPRGCMTLLMINLIIIFGANILYGNVREILGPYLMNKWKAWNIDVTDVPDVEKQFHRERYDETMGILMDYAEMAVQFGYMTLFVSAMPFTPLLGLINNWVEVQTDAFKLLTQYQRPQPIPVQDIGTWQIVFQVLVPDTPSVIMYQQKRTEYIVSRLIDRVINEGKQPPGKLPNFPDVNILENKQDSKIDPGGLNIDYYNPASHKSKHYNLTKDVTRQHIV